MATDDSISGLGAGTMQLVGNLNLVSTSAALVPTRMTTVQRDALTAVTGMVIYNTTTNKLNVRVAAAWEAITSA